MDATAIDVNMASLLLATAAVLVAIVGSTLTIVTLMFRQSNRHEDSIKALDAKFAKEFTRVHGEFTRVHGEFKRVHGEFTRVRRDIFGVAERLARVEGHLTAPQGFRPHRPLQPEADDSTIHDPNDEAEGQRQAG